jgi:hypothetical protein
VSWQLLPATSFPAPPLSDASAIHMKNASAPPNILILPVGISRLNKAQAFSRLFLLKAQVIGQFNAPANEHGKFDSALLTVERNRKE